MSKEPGSGSGFFHFQKPLFKNFLGTTYWECAVWFLAKGPLFLKVSLIIGDKCPDPDTQDFISIERTEEGAFWSGAISNLHVITCMGRCMAWATWKHGFPVALPLVPSVAQMGMQGAGDINSGAY